MHPKFPYALLGFILALAALLPTTARGENGEFYVNTYRSIGTISPIGVRETAMGGTGVGLADGVASLGQNPAALGAFKGSAIDAALGFDWLVDDKDNTTQITFKLGGAMNIDRWSNCTSNNQAIGGLIYTEGFSGAGHTDMKRSQWGVLGGYGIHLLDNLLVGVSVAFFDGKWSATAWEAPPHITVPAIDRKFIGGEFKVGGLYRIQDETTVGATVGFSTGSFKDRAVYAESADSGTLQRYSLGVGIAHQLTDVTLLSGDIWYKRVQTNLPLINSQPSFLKEHDNSWGVAAGIEQQIICDVLALRGGMYYDHTSYGSEGTGNPPFVPNGRYSRGRVGFTAGLGVKLYDWDMGYAMDVNTRGDVKNMLDVTKVW